MSYIRPGHVMRHVDGVSTDYVYCDGLDIVDYGKVSDDGLVEMLGRYFCQRKYGRDDAFEKYMMQRLAMRLGVKLRPRPLSKDEWVALDGVLWRKAQKGVQKDFPELFGKGKGRVSSVLSSRSGKRSVGMSTVSISVAKRFGSSTSGTRPASLGRSR